VSFGLADVDWHNSVLNGRTDLDDGTAGLGAGKALDGAETSLTLLGLEGWVSVGESLGNGLSGTLQARTGVTGDTAGRDITGATGSGNATEALATTWGLVSFWLSNGDGAGEGGTNDAKSGESVLHVCSCFRG
jgi:hypothetical protein